ncbi:hypothetical protein B0H10DRAFT_1926518 [Mycena sp. CBHHK59/15]|nr:hypothetical protein B0H10DRAFT_1926518 [Mycena sp. CBHHK59/15]
MDGPSRRYFWALLSPSALHSVAYLHSAFATSAASELECGQYLALVLEPSKHDPLLGHQKPSTVAYLVQPCDCPLPETYLPIAPCQFGSREPLVPNFEWPFEDCVINTGKIFVFDTTDVSSAMISRSRILSVDAAHYFAAIQKEDRLVQIEKDYQTRIAGREIAGSLDDDTRWTTFSRKSTKAEIVPGSFFPPVNISVEICVDIESLEHVLPASQCFEDVRNVQRLRARFSRPSTERTIIWTINQASCAVVGAPPDADALDFENPDLLEFSSTFERPLTPDGVEPPIRPVPAEEEEDDDVEPDLGDGWVDGIAVFDFPPAPKFEPRVLLVMYFDVYGTLIDHESGIFNALTPLLARSSCRFERKEGLSFYFESESKVKEHQPTAPYLEVLAQAHNDMALRLGLTSTDEESSTFASSLFDWPLFDDAVQCLEALQPYIPALVALVDIDYATLLRTAALPILQPYFPEVFSWDLSNVYRPTLDAYDPPLIYHDERGVPREHRVHVSSALFHDLELVAEVDIPAVWMRYPGSLAADVPAEDGFFTWKVCETLPQLVLEILAAKARQWSPPIE